jgi:hypothetical protein
MLYGALPVATVVTFCINLVVSNLLNVRSPSVATIEALEKDGQSLWFVL